METKRKKRNQVMKHMYKTEKQSDLFHSEIQKVYFSLQTLVRVWTKVRFRGLRWAPYKKTLIIK